jgi:hypothetical protein
LIIGLSALRLILILSNVLQIINFLSLNKKIMAQKTCSNGHKYTGDKCPYCPGIGPKLRLHKTRLFGTTIRETIDVLKQKPSQRQDATAAHDRKVILCRIAVSVAGLVFAAIFFTGEDHGTATGLVGTVIGYWLK